MKMLEKSNEAWEAFPELPGEHLSWYQAARWVSNIETRDGRLLATVEGLSLFPPWPLLPRPPRRVKIDQDTYHVKGRRVNAYVTTPDGLTILSFTGTKNSDLRARAVAHLPNGQSLRFPVQGTSRVNAVMTATDVSGRPVFRIRKVRNNRREQGHKKVVEILVEPGIKITPELLLVMAAGYHNLDNFFDRNRGG